MNNAFLSLRCLGFFLCFIFCLACPAQALDKHRVLILTDMEADPDDTQSLVRLLLYANQIDIEGLVATTSCWLQNEVNPKSIHKVIEAYAKVHANLAQHEAGFPSAKHLQKLVKQGLPSYGMLAVGENKDSEGSEWIIHRLKAEDPRPLWISVWGGVNTLAQALYKINNTFSESEAARLIAKLRVYTISDQDDSGIWIRNNFPDLFYIVSPGDDYGSATWTGINTVVSGMDNRRISTAWLAQNIQQQHGPLGAIYPDVAWGMEGDTPAYLSLIPNGLNNPERPEWGAWGGRYEWYKPDFTLTKDGGSIVEIAPETRKIWTNAIDTYTPYIAKEFGRAVGPGKQSFTGYKETLWRWRQDFQNDFAARMDWTIAAYQDANHPPVPILNHAAALTAEAGSMLTLNASPSYDPDGDSLSYLWFYYPEAGSYKKAIKFDGAENTQRVSIKLPQVEQAQTAHFILRVSDKGEPSLSRYQRVIITIQPKH